jgi:hypothetical protein
MPTIAEMIGVRYSKWVVLRKDRPKYVICQCDCGTERSVRASAVGRGDSTNCGCVPQSHQVDLLGQRFGILTVTQRVGFRGWRAACDCGGERVGRPHTLTVGHCGCLRNQRIALGRAEHGLSRTPEHKVWEAMRRRCRSPNDTRYADYGGRGIRVCARWDESFVAFLDDMGKRPSAQHSIERKDNYGNYEPGNCYWATRLEQACNKRNNAVLEHNGERLILSEWQRRTGLPVSTLSRRIARGWSSADVLKIYESGPRKTGANRKARVSRQNAGHGRA